VGKQRNDLAPIALFAYNRPQHTRQTIESLQRNVLAKDSDLIIFSDAPKHEASAEAVGEVRKYIRKVEKFKSVTIVERDKNWGLANSIIDGVTSVVKEHEHIIVLEDDIITSSHFLEYMNAALIHYKEDPQAFSVGAYSFPAQTMPIPSDYHWDTYAGFRCCSWGWATWTDRWKRIDWDMDYYNTFMRDQGAQELFNRGGPDMSQLLKLQYERRIDSWAIRFCYAHYANRMHCIYPVKTLVINIGLDNTGTHCDVDPRREHRALDDKWIPRSFCPAGQVDAQLALNFYNAFSPPELSLIARMVRKLRK
jgi:Glycosyl transferase family 2